MIFMHKFYIFFFSHSILYYWAPGSYFIHLNLSFFSPWGLFSPHCYTYFIVIFKISPITGCVCTRLPLYLRPKSDFKIWLSIEWDWYTRTIKHSAKEILIFIQLCNTHQLTLPFVPVTWMILRWSSSSTFDTQTHTSDNTEGHIYYDTVCNSKCFLRPDWLTVRPARSRKPLMAFSCSWGLLRSRRTCSKALAFVCSVFRVQMASWGERKMFEDGINNLQERVSEWKDEDQSDLESDRCFVSSAHVRR